jgi:hypothetical protein
MTTFTIGIASSDLAATRRLFAEGLGLPEHRPDRYLLGGVAFDVHPPHEERTGPDTLTVHTPDPQRLRKQLEDDGHAVTGEGPRGSAVLGGVAVRVAPETSRS